MMEHGISRVAADPAVVPAAAIPGGHPGWTYWRWHGAPRMYYSDYDEAALAALAADFAATRAATPPWIVFDNTAHGFATANAARLQEMLGTRAARKRGRA